MQVFGLKINLITESEYLAGRHKMCPSVLQWTYMHAPGKLSDMTRVVRSAKRESIPNSTDFYMYLVGKYMRLPRFGKPAKIQNPLGMLDWDPMAPI